MEELIAEHHATWAPLPLHVELAIFGTASAERVAREIDALCTAALGSPIAGARFYVASIGAVAGVVLVDGRRVVVKLHQPSVGADQLAEMVRLRAQLTTCGSPLVLAGPLPIARGHVVIEQLDERGAWADPDEPDVRRALARGLHQIVETCRPFVASSPLADRAWAVPADRLWPVPHSKLFDFDATAAGAEWIDQIARAARAIEPAGDLVIGHMDWRAEHVRFDGGAVVVAYDWDSLDRTREPVLIGSAAHGFRADWSREGRRQAPTLEEARAFIDVYADARGRPFDAGERAALGAAFAYSCAYTARCSYSIDFDQRGTSGTFQALCALGADALLAVAA